MASLRAQVLAVLTCTAASLLCCVVLAGSAHADSIPSDPIIDTEPGCCSTPFSGQITVQFVAADYGSNCTSFSDTLDICGSTASFLTQFRVDGVLTASTLNNMSSSEITDLDFLFSIAEAPFTAQPGSIFSGPVITPSPFEAIYTLGPGKSPICSSTSPDNCIGNCPILLTANQPTGCLPSDVALGFAQLFIPKTGALNLTITSNVPAPEPTSLALIASMLPAVWIARRKLQRP